MNKDQIEKQAIEEMAKDVARSISWCNEEIPTVDCLGTAASLYAKDYRKQSEGEWIRKDGFEVCSKCDATKPIAFSTVLKITYYKCDFCPKCGAKMKGGAG
jgi:hypothetical protein